MPADSGPAQDVNADGALEYWGLPYGGYLTIIQDGVISQLSEEQRDLLISRIELGGSAIAWDRTRVFPPDFGAWVQSQVPNCDQATLVFPYGQPGFHGWRDMDGDHDLDFVANVHFQYLSNGGSFQVWFENIGFEKPAPPIAADINGDGQVNGADLGLLLVAWGPNP